MRAPFVSIAQAVLAIAVAAELRPEEPFTIEPGFVSLFDGKDIEQHFAVKGNRKSWEAVDGAIVARAGGDRIMSRRQYGDFILRLDWKIAAQGNSGIFIRVPSQDDGAPWVTGFEVQISNAPRDSSHCTGSLYGAEKVKEKPDESADVWHAFEIICLGGHITVSSDGVHCIDARYDTNPKMRSRPTRGYIGLQDYHAGGGKTVMYRNIRIQELNPDGTVPGFRRLTKDGKGWRKTPTGHGTGGRWEFLRGAWVGQQDPPGSGNGGVLISEEEFGDFELIIELQPDWGIDSGIFLRSTERGECYQILVDYHGRGGGGNVGGIYGESIGGFGVRNYNFTSVKTIELTTAGEARPLPFPAADWFRYWKLDGYNEIRTRVVGNPPTIDVWINRQHVTHFRDAKKRLGNKGHLGLQVHGGKGSWPPDARVRYRRIQVRELRNPQSR